MPGFVKVWFAADLALALLPPLHWAVGGMATLFGVPLVFIYLIGSSAFIAASVVVAYFCDDREVSR